MSKRRRVEFPDAECLASAARAAEAIRTYWLARGYDVTVSVDARTAEIVCDDLVDGQPVNRCRISKAVAS